MRRYQVLFVCIGNSCRSQMAEAFANRLGSDVMRAKSAGLAPCGVVSSTTIKLMRERNLHLDDARSKGLGETGTDFDIIVNMSGWPLPTGLAAEMREWPVEDPIGFTEERHREVRDHIEALVADLAAELRHLRATGGRRNLPRARSGI